MKIRKLPRPLRILVSFAVSGTAPAGPLEEGFRHPPDSAKPHTWWHWMNGNITREGKPSPNGRLTFTTWHHWTKDSKLIESGLIGPVSLRTAEWVPTR